MPLLTLDDFAETCPRGRLLGFDPGTKTIGLALSDGMQSIASPLETIKRTKFTMDAERITALAAEHAIVGFVVGLPLNMDGSEGPRAQGVRAFQRNLDAKLPMPTLFWDERLTTMAAERAMLEADLSRKKRAAHIDAAAAGLILQGALDRLSTLRRAP